eukprot:1325962-Rhodomonas_salina.1
MIIAVLHKLLNQEVHRVQQSRAPPRKPRIAKFKVNLREAQDPDTPVPRYPGYQSRNHGWGCIVHLPGYPGTRVPSTL